MSGEMMGEGVEMEMRDALVAVEEIWYLGAHSNPYTVLHVDFGTRWRSGCVCTTTQATVSLSQQKMLNSLMRRGIRWNKAHVGI
jgi:hypothetical protein